MSHSYDTEILSNFRHPSAYPSRQAAAAMEGLRRWVPTRALPAFEITVGCRGTSLTRWDDNHHSWRAHAAASCLPPFKAAFGRWYGDLLLSLCFTLNEPGTTMPLTTPPSPYDPAPLRRLLVNRSTASCTGADEYIVNGDVFNGLIRLKAHIVKARSIPSRSDASSYDSGSGILAVMVPPSRGSSPR